MNNRLDATLAMNQEFADALERGDSWAVNYADASRGIDGESNRRHPERAFKEDGVTRQNWCGACSDPKGCITCDLDHPTGDAYTAIKPCIGKDSS